jgi:hypothetical protein
LLDAGTIDSRPVERPTHVLSSSSPPANEIIHPSQSLSVILPPTRPMGMVTVVLSGGHQLLSSFSLCLCGQHDVVPPLPPMKCHCHHHHRLHVIVAAAHAKERWFGAMRHHHRRAGLTSSPQEVALELPSRSAKKSANRKSN